MKTRSQRMQIVADLATKKRVQADQFLAASRQRVEQDRAGVRQLEQYLIEYQQGLIDQGKKGINVGDIRMQQAFIYKVQTALEKQRLSLQQNLKELETVEQYWRQVYARQSGLNSLVEKLSLAEQVEKDRVLQKELDEFSSRLNLGGGLESKES